MTPTTSRPVQSSTPWPLLITALLGLLLFVVIAIAVSSHSPSMVALDQLVYQTLQAHRSDGWDQLMVFITQIGDAAVTVPLTLGVLAWMLWRRAWRTAVYWAVAASVGTGLVGLVKNLTEVARPQDLYTGLSSFSFPSGHTAMSMVVYGLLAFFISRELPARQRWWPFVAAGMLTGCIGFSRLYLGAHWLSDVVGGLSLALAWIGMLALAWQRGERCHQPLTGLLPVALLVMLVATAWHVYHGSEASHARYQQPHAPHAAGELLGNP